MPDGQLIEFDRVTKRFGAVAAVSDFSARVNPGVVTGFLGPNGAGKTTTLRMLVGLERPTIGTTKIGGTRFSELREPARVIGAMLENPGFRVRRTVERHLIATAKANSIPLSRVGELISFVGLGDDTETRIAALSLGMRQRLSAATALLGDPGVLVLDEPANGLDPEGIRWMRTLIRGLADDGRTVLVSSHVLSEVEQTADEILVIASGELKFAGTMEDLADPSTGPVVVDAPDRAELSRALRAAGFEFEVLRSGLTVRGSDAASIGAVTAAAGVALTTLQQRGPTLEDVFLDLVNDRYVRPATIVKDAAPAADAPVIAAVPEEPGTDTDEPAASLFGSVRASRIEEESRADAADRPAAEDGADAAAGSVPQDDARPLPGIAGLAAVASLFNTTARTSATGAEGEGESEGGAEPEQSAPDAVEDTDLDATRVIEIVRDADANLDGADPTDEFFDAFTGDPSSDDDGEQDASSRNESEDDDADRSDRADQGGAEDDPDRSESAHEHLRRGGAG